MVGTGAAIIGNIKGTKDVKIIRQCTCPLNSHSGDWLVIYSFLKTQTFTYHKGTT